MRWAASLAAAACACACVVLSTRPWVQVRARAVLRRHAGGDGGDGGDGCDGLEGPYGRDGIGRLLRILRRLSPSPVVRRRKAAERARILQALSALASELEAGQPPSAALSAAAGDPPAWPQALRAAGAASDVVEALRRDALAHPVLVMLAACWEVSANSGAGLAAAVTRLAASARQAEDVRVQLEAHLAGPRATARMLGLLPLVGLGLGTVMGAEPIAWLVGTPVGAACALAGAALTALGMWWTGRIARSVEARL